MNWSLVWALTISSSPMLSTVAGSPKPSLEYTLPFLTCIPFSVGLNSIMLFRFPLVVSPFTVVGVEDEFLDSGYITFRLPILIVIIYISAAYLISINI